MDTPRPACPPLLARLVDDAGLFPPTQLSMVDALARHRRDGAAAHPMLTHRFLLGASRLGELRATLAEGGRVRLGLILDLPVGSWAAAVGEARGDERLTVEVVEVPLPADRPGEAASREVLDALSSIVPDTPALLEPARSAPGWLETIAVVAAAASPAGLAGGPSSPGDLAGTPSSAGAVAGAAPGPLRGLKVRCGGIRADLFPTPAELAAFIAGCAAAGVACKPTAGLHHAVRHRDPATGFDHFGYLNLLVASARAAAGAGRVAIEDALAGTDADALAGEARGMADDTALAARRLMPSYGSCSTSEPLAEAAALGLIDPR